MKIAVVGPVTKDILIHPDHVEHRVGGVTHYTGEALHALGVDTVVYGSYGTEPQGWPEFSCRLVHVPSEGTMEFTNDYTKREGINDREQRARIPASHIDASVLSSEKDLDLIVLGPLFHDNFTPKDVRRFAQIAPVALAPQGMIRYLDGGKIVFDHPENVLDALVYVNYLFLDQKELQFVSGIDDIDKGAAYLVDWGANKIAVTLGERGSRLFTPNRSYQINAFPAKPPIHPTGAGDSYMAGFLAALDTAEDPEYCGRFAAMTATMAIEREGPFQGTRRIVQARRLMELDKELKKGKK